MICHNLTNSAHHDDPAIGNSGIKAFLRCPARYFADYRHPDRQPTEPSPAMITGTAWHAALFEPERFALEYVAVPEGLDRRTKEGKQFFADIEAAGRFPMKAEAHAEIIAMRKAAEETPFMRRMATHAGWMSERSIFVTCPDTGLQLKIRPDTMLPPCEAFPHGIIIDGKTCTDAEPEAFGRAIWAYGYHMQAAFYRRVYQLHYQTAEPPVFVLFAQEKSWPYLCKPYTVPTEALEYAGAMIDNTLERMAECEASGIWPGYGDEIDTATLPGYARFEMDGDNAVVNMEIVNEHG